MEAIKSKLVAPPIDPFSEKKWLSVIAGYAPTYSLSYKLFRICIFIFFLFIHFLSLHSIYVVSADKNLTADAIHIYAANVWHIWCFVSRVLTDRSLMKMRDMIFSGIYIYDKEEPDDEIVKMHNGIASEIKKKANTLTSIYVVGFFSVITFPLSEYAFNKHEPDKFLVVNPYLPHPYHFPFDTTTVIGFMAAYLIDLSYWTFVYSTAIAQGALVISNTVHMRVHLRILSHSLTTIQKRAYQMYKRKRNGQIEEGSADELLESKVFHDCLRTCLKANIQHHQAIVRFKKICQPLNGLSLLSMFTVVIIVYAAMLYLLLQNLPMNMMMKYSGTFIAEQTYAFVICNFGQEVTTESDDLFLSVYDVPWFSYDKNFKQNLHIMMSNTRAPLTIKAFLLDFSATLHSYSVLLSTIYKVMNIWRQTDKIK